MDSGGVATSWDWLEAILAYGQDFSVSLSGKVKLPQIAEFVIKVILSSKDIAFSIIDAAALWGSDAWLIRAILTYLFPL